MSLDYDCSLLKFVPKELIKELSEYRRRERELANSDAFYFFLNEVWEFDIGDEGPPDDNTYKIVKEINDILGTYTDLYYGKLPIEFDERNQQILTVRMEEIAENKFVIPNKLLADIIVQYASHEDTRLSLDEIILLVNKKLIKYGSNLRLTLDARKGDDRNNFRVVAIYDEY